MKMIKLAPLAQFAAAALLLGMVAASHSATIVKANNADALNLTSSWTGAVVPGASDTAVWDATVAGANSPALGRSPATTDTPPRSRRAAPAR